MASAHTHEHGDDLGKLRIAVATTIALFALEAIGGMLSGSLALLADAAHMLTDVAAAALGLWAAQIAMWQADERRTFGYGRATVLAALTNAAVLFAIVLFLIFEAVQRLRSPATPNTMLMIGIALIAIVANGSLAFVLARSASASLNLRAVLLHVMGDAAISVAVIVAALVVRFTGFVQADPIASMLAAIAVSYSAWNLIRRSLHVLMEGVPEGISMGSVNQALLSVPSVDAVHDVHVWSVGDRTIAASLHVRVPSTALVESQRIVSDVKKLLHDRFHITHATVEVECEDCGEAC